MQCTLLGTALEGLGTAAIAEYCFYKPDAVGTCILFSHCCDSCTECLLASRPSSRVALCRVLCTTFRDDISLYECLVCLFSVCWTLWRFFVQLKGQLQEAGSLHIMTSRLWNRHPEQGVGFSTSPSECGWKRICSGRSLADLILRSVHVGAHLMFLCEQLWTVNGGIPCLI